MAEGINLLPQVTEGEVKRASYKRSVNVFAIVALLIVAAILLSLFAYQFFLVSTARRISVQTKTAEETIVQNSDKEINHRSLVEKLQEATKFLATAIPYSDAFDKLTSVLNKSAVALTDSKFEADGDVTLDGKASSSGQFGKLVDELTSQELTKSYTGVNLVSLTKEIEKPYVFKVDLKYIKKGLPLATSSASLQ